ncbi:MAG: hypothetical protein ABEI31_02030 [Halodesulfurarchaeum sp.]
MNLGRVLYVSARFYVLLLFVLGIVTTLGVALRISPALAPLGALWFVAAIVGLALLFVAVQVYRELARL